MENILKNVSDIMAQSGQIIQLIGMLIVGVFFCLDKEDMPINPNIFKDLLAHQAESCGIDITTLWNQSIKS